MGQNTFASFYGSVMKQKTGAKKATHTTMGKKVANEREAANEPTEPRESFKRERKPIHIISVCRIIMVKCKACGATTPSTTKKRIL